MTTITAEDLALLCQPLPKPALSALADLVELRARKLFPEKFVAHPLEAPDSGLSDDED